ncbi:MAG: methylmalonyl Co-A mutase-associated GTPase MeaB, partial [Ferruginibacter sp.]
DEVQTMKSGLMEIADIFVVNKADRPGAATFVKNLHQMLAPAFHQQLHEIAVIKTIAAQKHGIEELKAQIELLKSIPKKDRKAWLLAEKAYQLIRNRRMKNVNKADLKLAIENSTNFNLYQFVAAYEAEKA